VPDVYPTPPDPPDEEIYTCAATVATELDDCAPWPPCKYEPEVPVEVTPLFVHLTAPTVEFVDLPPPVATVIPVTTIVPTLVDPPAPPGFPSVRTAFTEAPPVPPAPIVTT
jgi:hypothetical protein